MGRRTGVVTLTTVELMQVVLEKREKARGKNERGGSCS